MKINKTLIPRENPDQDYEVNLWAAQFTELQRKYDRLREYCEKLRTGNKITKPPTSAVAVSAAKSIIFCYIRNKKKQRIGMILAEMEHKTVNFGWSLCHKADKFDRATAIMVARNHLKMPMPKKFTKAATKFQSRSMNYFKDARVIGSITFQS